MWHDHRLRLYVVQHGHEIDMCCDKIGMGVCSVIDFILGFITRLGWEGLLTYMIIEEYEALRCVIQDANSNRLFPRAIQCP